ncbi:putative microtubule-associated protein 6 [Homarus americanus]|uniref:Putative microtubule-associated protein 6 n=1 Tax=Homarus americanus TaxID=6706 RepID=A0A8J5NBV8_HOMAM|nr:putative microtubule-associated protein 6 [Homarus americanus]
MLTILQPHSEASMEPLVCTSSHTRGRKLYIAGFTYTRNRIRGIRSYWRCTIRSCPGRLVLLRDDVVKTKTHSHPPNMDGNRTTDRTEAASGVVLGHIIGPTGDLTDGQLGVLGTLLDQAAGGRLYRPGSGSSTLLDQAAGGRHCQRRHLDQAAGVLGTLLDQAAGVLGTLLDQAAGVLGHSTRPGSGGSTDQAGVLGTLLDQAAGVLGTLLDQAAGVLGTSVGSGEYPYSGREMFNITYELWEDGETIKVPEMSRYTYLQHCNYNGFPELHRKNNGVYYQFECHCLANTSGDTCQWGNACPASTPTPLYCDGQLECHHLCQMANVTYRIRGRRKAQPKVVQVNHLWQYHWSGQYTWEDSEEQSPTTKEDQTRDPGRIGDRPDQGNPTIDHGRDRRGGPI